MAKSEKEKAIEMLKWLDLFDTLRCKVNNYAINTKTFNLGLKEEIETLRQECLKIK
jgi:hypothetical protein